MASKRTSAIDRVKKDNLFKDTTSQFVNNETNQDENTGKLVDASKSTDYKRQTYYLEEDLIQAIGLKAVFEKKDKSEIVREALRAYIEDKYFNLLNN